MLNAHIHHDKSASIHRIPSLGKGHCSAYLDASGDLIDAEQITSPGRSRPVKKGGPLWEHVAKRAKLIYSAALAS